MTERPETVADLDPDREIISVQNSDIVHLVDADCHAKLSIERGRVTTAAAMWDSSAICEYCSNRFDAGDAGAGGPVFDPTRGEFRADGGGSE